MTAAIAEPEAPAVIEQPRAYITQIREFECDCPRSRGAKDRETGFQVPCSCLKRSLWGFDVALNQRVVSFARSHSDVWPKSEGRHPVGKVPVTMLTDTEAEQLRARITDHMGMRRGSGAITYRLAGVTAEGKGDGYHLERQVGDIPLIDMLILEPMDASTDQLAEANTMIADLQAEIDAMRAANEEQAELDEEQEERDEAATKPARSTGPRNKRGKRQ